MRWDGGLTFDKHHLSSARERYALLDRFPYEVSDYVGYCSLVLLCCFNKTERHDRKRTLRTINERHYTGEKGVGEYTSGGEYTDGMGPGRL